MHEHLDDMPALAMFRGHHRPLRNSGVPAEATFHRILREEMHDLPLTDRSNAAAVLPRLRAAYRRFEGLEPEGPPATDPAVWRLVEKWLETQGVAS